MKTLSEYKQQIELLFEKGHEVFSGYLLSGDKSIHDEASKYWNEARELTVEMYKAYPKRFKSRPEIKETRRLLSSYDHKSDLHELDRRRQSSFISKYAYSRQYYSYKYNHFEKVIARALRLRVIKPNEIKQTWNELARRYGYVRNKNANFDAVYSYLDCEEALLQYFSGFDYLDLYRPSIDASGARVDRCRYFTSYSLIETKETINELYDEIQNQLRQLDGKLYSDLQKCDFCQHLKQADALKYETFLLTQNDRRKEGKDWKTKNSLNVCDNCLPKFTAINKELDNIKAINSLIHKIRKEAIQCQKSRQQAI